MTTAAMLTPFLEDEASRVELANRVWRKKLLPFGDIDYKGRTLRFTRDYLGRIVTAFNDRAYDQVPFQLADAQNTHTNDPERTRGEITGMELGEDGLYVTAQLTPDGEKVLEANPKLGVSARIVEGYARSDGKHFSAAVQHVLGTLDPRIPGLGAWEAIEAASPEPDTVLDLSRESFTDLVGPKGFEHGWVHVGGTQAPKGKAKRGGPPQMRTADPNEVTGLDSHGKPVTRGQQDKSTWLTKGTKNLGPSEAADKMSANISGRNFPDGPDGAGAQAAHRAAAKAHRQAAKATDHPFAVAHHEDMARLHSSVASGRMESYAAQKKMADLAGDGTDPEGGAVMAGLKSLSDEQRQRLEKLLSLPDETLDALAAGGTVVTPEELDALTAPGDNEDGEDEGEADALAEEIAGMSDEDLAALEAEFEAEAGSEPDAGDRAPEREPVTAGLGNDEYEFAMAMAISKQEETARELAVVTARLREEDFQAERRRLADMGVPPYITDLAKPLLEGAGHAVELSNGKTVDAGAIMRRVLAEYGRQVKLLDLGAELGSPMDEPEDAGREEAGQSRQDLVARFRSMTGA